MRFCSPCRRTRCIRSMIHHCGDKVALMLVAAIATSQGWLENRLHDFLLPEHDCGRPERNKWITAFYFHTAQSSSYHLLYPHPPAESRVTTTNPRLDEAQTMGCSTAGTTRMLCISQLTQRSAHHQNERTTFHARNHPPGFRRKLYHAERRAGVACNISRIPGYRPSIDL